MAEAMDGTGAGLDAFLEWAGSKGEIKPSTAQNLRSASRAVLSVEGEAAEVDVREADAEALLDRWENLNRTRYSTDSLTTYRSRFRQGLAMYLAWLNKEPSWRTAGKASPSQGTPGAAKPGRPRRRNQRDPSPDARLHHQEADAPQTGAVRLHAYEMPLRPDLIVRLTLPIDLTATDAARLNSFVNSLVFSEPSSGPASTEAP